MVRGITAQLRLRTFLRKEISRLERQKIDSPSNMESNDELTRVAFTVALEALDAEPLAWLRQSEHMGIPVITSSKEIANNWYSEGWRVIPLYAASYRD